MQTTTQAEMQATTQTTQTIITATQTTTQAEMQATTQTTITTITTIQTTTQAKTHLAETLVVQTTDSKMSKKDCTVCAIFFIDSIFCST